MIVVDIFIKMNLKNITISLSQRFTIVYLPLSNTLKTNIKLQKAEVGCSVSNSLEKLQKSSTFWGNLKHTVLNSFSQIHVRSKEEDAVIMMSENVFHRFVLC